MAASSSTSVSFSNTWCALSSRRPAFSFKTISPPQSNFYQFLVCKNNNPAILLPIKDGGFSISLSKLHQPILAQHSNTKRGFFLRASSSDPPQHSSSQTINGPDDQVVLGDSENEAGHSLKSLLQVYKEAILGGDGKTVSEIEAVLYMVEKEKNQLVQKVSALSAEINSGKEKYIRLQADFDNFRKRSEKERLTVRTDAQGEVIESLLPMVDNFERAKQQLKPETEKENKIDASYQGIYKQFVEIMRSLRVAAVPTVGKPFDPSVHEAIAREVSQEFKEGIVMQEFRRGFVLGNRLLRPAMVKVSSGPGKKKQAPVADKAAEQAATAGGVDER